MSKKVRKYFGVNCTNTIGFYDFSAAASHQQIKEKKNDLFFYALKTLTYKLSSSSRV